MNNQIIYGSLDVGCSNAPKALIGLHSPRSHLFFEEVSMNKFKRLTIPLCACGCEDFVKKDFFGKKWNKFIAGHQNRGKNNPSFGKLGKDNPSFGLKRSDEIKKKMSAIKMGVKRVPFSQKTIDKIKKALTGKIVSEETKRKISKTKTGTKLSEEHKRKISISCSYRKMTNKQKKQVSERMKGNNYTKGRILSIEEREAISKRMKRNKSRAGLKHSAETCLKISLSNMGEQSSQWKGGISCEPYCDIWLDKDYKNSIKERDNWKCQNPDCWKTSNKLCIHHIDYDKKNCKPENLITLCISCNTRANSNREYWTKFYQGIMNLKNRGNLLWQ